jgi:hypothetical protein
MGADKSAKNTPNALKKVGPICLPKPKPKTTTSRCNFVLFYEFKMALAIASLCVNASD